MARPPVGSHADLLSQRRLEQGLPATAKRLQPARPLLFMGAGIGATLVAVSALLAALLVVQETSLQSQINGLLPLEKRVLEGRQRLQTTRARTKTLQSDTQRIATQLVSVRSGSAFLEQLRRVTPEGLQLRSVAVQPTRLTISGWAERSAVTGAFERINALALNLEGLPEVPDGGVIVKKVSAGDPGITEFSLTVLIDAAIKASPEELQGLGALGLARRYRLLQREGIEL